MIAFTAIGLLWFWLLCFEIGYALIPTFRAVRAAWALWLFGRQVEHAINIFQEKCNA
jgi:hypothetical protein